MRIFQLACALALFAGGLSCCSNGASAQGTDAQFNAILTYLVKNFGPEVSKININKAPAKDLETQLEITAKEAEAIVKYRDEKGAFKEVDDLKKVPDLDFKKIEAKKDRLAF